MSYPNAGWPEEEWKGEVIARLQALARVADDGGVTLVHENCSGWGGLGASQTLELLERVHSPALKLVWDTGNPIGYGQDPWQYYQAVKQNVVYVHIKDAVSKDGKAVYSFPGEGEGRVGDVIRDLLRNGYDGGFSIEPHLAAIVHEGKAASAARDSYGLYLEYGRRLMALVSRVRAG
jgi:sugar phosphate isomerase/epimerase